LVIRLQHVSKEDLAKNKGPRTKIQEQRDTGVLLRFSGGHQEARLYNVHVYALFLSLSIAKTISTVIIFSSGSPDLQWKLTRPFFPLLQQACEH
jgi:hypothetical protein